MKQSDLRLLDVSLFACVSLFCLDSEGMESGRWVSWCYFCAMSEDTGLVSIKVFCDLHIDWSLINHSCRWGIGVVVWHEVVRDLHVFIKWLAWSSLLIIPGRWGASISCCWSSGIGHHWALEILIVMVQMDNHWALIIRRGIKFHDNDGKYAAHLTRLHTKYYFVLKKWHGCYELSHS